MKSKVIDTWENRPYCSELGCEGKAQNSSTTENPRWRKHPDIKGGYICYQHHFERNNFFGSGSAYAYLLRIHPYLKYRKDYCENSDGRLGYKCTAVIPDRCCLHVDHKDGNPENNSPENLQTLCAVCHAYKTKINGDGRTPGRKFLKEIKKNEKENKEKKKIKTADSTYANKGIRERRQKALSSQKEA